MKFDSQRNLFGDNTAPNKTPIFLKGMSGEQLVVNERKKLGLNIYRLLDFNYF